MGESRREEVAGRGRGLGGAYEGWAGEVFKAQALEAALLGTVRGGARGGAYEV